MPPLELLLADGPQARRLHALVTAGVAVAVLLLLVWPLADLLVTQRVEITALEQEKAGQARLASRAERLLSEGAELAALNSAAADYVTGDSASLAGATLQGMLVQRLANVGGQLISAQIMPADPEGDGTVVGVRLDAGLNNTQLRALLHAVEGGQPRLVVRSLTLRPVDAATGRLALSMVVDGRRRMPGDR